MSGCGGGGYWMEREIRSKDFNNLEVSKEGRSIDRVRRSKL